MEYDMTELNITKLREERRPLWMSSLGIDNYADMIGGGGDLWQDRLSMEWARYTGEELTDEEANELGFEGAETYESAQSYESAGSEEQVSQSVESSTSSSSQEASSSTQEGSPGVGVGADVNVRVSGVSETVDEVTGAVSDTVSKTTKTLGNILGGVTKKVKDTTK
jgi:hypothetical protein